MSNKRPTPEELGAALQKADLVERQNEEMDLIKAEELREISGYTAERDMANQLLGQVQAALTVGDFAKSLSVLKLKNIKENKSYRHLSGQVAFDKDGNKIANVGTWAGFCAAIGISRQKADEDIANLKVLGEEALSSLQRIGFGYRELSRLRRLPEPDRETIINGEAVRLDDKDEVLALIDDLAAKHVKEKETLQRKADALQKDLDAARSVAENKGRKLNELEEQLHRRERMKPDERVEDLSARLNRAVMCAASAFMEPKVVIQEILEWEGSPRDLRHACALSIARLKVALDQLQQDFQLPDIPMDVDDSWMQGLEFGGDR